MNTINKATLDFLVDLRCNNDRDWFIKNRSRYDSARSNYESFIQEIIDRISIFEPILKGLEAKTCIYRINRDIRFSNDKTLYKTHFGAFIVRGGRKNGDRFPGYYVHVEPGNSMIAGGAYMPPSPWLSAIRERIDENGEKLLKITCHKDFKRIFGKIEGEKLKSAPKGYGRDHPFIDLLRYKSFLAFRNISDREITGSGSADLIIEACKAMIPFNDFLGGS